MPAKPEFNSLVKQFSERVYNHAYRMLGTREDAEEATTDVFLKIHNGLAGFRGDAQITTWIWRITTNVCLSRRAKKKIETVPMDNDLAGENPDAEQMSPSPEELFLREEAREDLGRAIAKLPEQEGAIITLFYLEGMKYDEIATILSLPAGTVATALHRGRERLRKRMCAERMKI